MSSSRVAALRRLAHVAHALETSGSAGSSSHDDDVSLAYPYADQAPPTSVAVHPARSAREFQPDCLVVPTPYSIGV